MNDTTHDTTTEQADTVIGHVTEQLMSRLTAVNLQIATLDNERARIERALSQLNADASFAAAWRTAGVEMTAAAIAPSRPATTDNEPSIHGAGFATEQPTTTKARRNGKRVAVRGAQRPLREVLIDVLRASGEPLKASQVSRHVLATGYATNAKHFDQVIYMTLKKSPQFKRTADGLWSLTRKATR